MELDRSRNREEQARFGDAVANDGTVLFTRQAPALLHNNGDNSQNARSRYRNFLDGVLHDQQKVTQNANTTTGTPCCICWLCLVNSSAGPYLL
jgi:hypothetical protein